MKLGKIAEAKTLLEGGLDIFRQAHDVTMEATFLSSLADVWDEIGDPAQAVTLARSALAVRDRLPDPGDRAISHNNLASYLHTTGAMAESAAHRLAALAYRLATGLDPRSSRHNLAIVIRQAAARGERFDFPRLADLLAKSTFAALRTFLAEREVPVADLQTAIDSLVEQARAAVAAQSSSS